MLLNLLKSGGGEELSLKEYEALFREFHKPIRNFIYFRCGDMDLADDLVQDVFLKLWDHRSRIERKTVKSYLYTIAQNLTINHQKRQSLFFKFTKGGMNDRDHDHPEKLMEMEEYNQRLTEAMNQLPEGGREVFLMNRLEDLTYQEIAGRLGLSVKAVEKRMSKVLKHFRDTLGTDL